MAPSETCGQKESCFMLSQIKTWSPKVNLQLKNQKLVYIIFPVFT